ncbi:MAG TPA: DUF5682 family protein [Streptosporangiaceae bacterium]
MAVLGIRHHGPGSARSVRAELDRLKPAAVLIEGPADAAPVLGLAADPGLVPPVALLAYAPEAPWTSAFWPFAVFSPEWQALTWAIAHDVPARFCDLPASVQLAPGREGRDGPADQDDDQHDDQHGDRHGPATAEDGPATAGDGQDPVHEDPVHEDPVHEDPVHEEPVRGDPVARLATAAGYDDPERWWEDVIESRLAGQPPFAALTEAMAELRADPPAVSPDAALLEQRREAHMRQAVRAALRDTAADGRPVAVICGAWHAPALAGSRETATADAALLRGLPRRRVALAWVPWTHARLATASGYGAGITSPGWYHHLFSTPDQVIERWMIKVARLLRNHDLPVSSAHVIDAVRLAEALAALRGRPLAGLAEVTDAAKAVMCDGDDFAAAFVTRDLVVGERLGTVPDTAPAVPLERDLRARARSLKLKISPDSQTIALDLRTPNGRARSVLLHRLSVLGIAWGERTGDLVSSTGTFRETWALAWHPELSVAIIDAARWGTTVAAAAEAKITAAAAAAGDLAAVTQAVEQVLLADLPGALGPVLAALDARAAQHGDVTGLMAAVPALVRAARYGDVRDTDTTALAAVADALTARVCAGLPAVAGGLADAAALALRAAVDRMHAAVGLHAQSGRGRAAQQLWTAALTALAGRRDVHGLLAGRVVRLLADSGALTPAEAAGRLAVQLTAGVPAAGQAAWAEGFLSGSGLLLVHDRDLLAVLDRWVAGLGEREFLAAAPLLRRAFSGYSAGERGNIAEAVRHLDGSGPRPGAAGEPADPGRAAGVLGTMALILGGER